MKYIVLYVWLQTLIVACPSPETVPDKYGRAYIPSYRTTEVCTRQVRHHMQKLFASLMEAKKFVAEASKEYDLVEFRLRKINMQDEATLSGKEPVKEDPLQEDPVKNNN